MRIARWVLGILGGLVLLALLTVLAVTVFVDPNRFRGQIERVVTRETGQPFDIQGDIEISWFPWLALRTGASQFGAGGDGSSEPLVKWRAARVGAKLIPLIHGQLVIDTIRLEQPEFRLVRHADGTANWDAVIEAFRQRGTQPEPEPTPTATPGVEQPAIPGPQIAGFQIRNGSLTFIDAQAEAPRTVTLSDWSLDVGEWRSGATFPLETQLTLRLGEDLRAEKLRIGTRMHVSEDGNDIDLFQLDFSSQIHAAALPEEGVPVEAEVSRTAVRLTPLDISISELSSRIAGVRLTTSVQAGHTGPERTPYVRGPIDLQVPSVRELLQRLGLEPALPLDRKTLGKLRLTSTLAWENGAITADPISVDLDETHFDGRLTRAAGENPLWTFALHGDKIELHRYVALEDDSDEPFELPIRELKALQARGELTFGQATMGEALLRGVKVRVELDEGELRTASR